MRVSSLVRTRSMNGGLSEKLPRVAAIKKAPEALRPNQAVGQCRDGKHPGPKDIQYLCTYAGLAMGSGTKKKASGMQREHEFEDATEDERGTVRHRGRARVSERAPYVSVYIGVSLGMDDASGVRKGGEMGEWGKRGWGRES